MSLGLRLFRASTFLFLSAFAPTLANAENEYATCIQKELSALGIAGVPVTGKLDRATKSGTEALRAAYPTVPLIANLPRVSEQSAVSWCREIAALKPSLRKLMPSSSPPIVLSTDGAGGTQTVMLQRSFQNVQQFFHSYYDIYLASRVDVAGAASGDQLAQLAVQLQRARGQSYGRMGASVAEVCRTPSNSYSGQAYRNQLLLCWPAAARYDSAWRNKASRTVSRVMAHEYMHHVQRELSSDKAGSSGNRSRSKMGPAWMVEGSAELAEYRWSVKRGGVSAKPVSILQKQARKSTKSLGGMHRHGSVDGGRQYRVAFLAVYLLAERYGEDAVIEYWRLLGQGKSWEASFRKVFGQSIGGYTQTFESLRFNTNNASAFMAGK